MTRNEVIKDLFTKGILPIAVAVLLFSIFKPVFTKDGTLDFIGLWIFCGMPFGLHKLRFWLIPGGGRMLGEAAALFVLNFIFAGVIGGFVLIWRLIVAVCYIPLTVYRLATG